ncbi:eug1p [Saccharomyces arboricola H-6]|uniref:protein disulfide-isomerase n=1 Tax=Saccharomyces arboricola (strain H-6 / AS 2.3317 / CBS 10644) TaxID=1160507 RepID=J8LJC2_SACAR|nr:eug1p [Saccharomyces arboricola H-6]
MQVTTKFVVSILSFWLFASSTLAQTNARAAPGSDVLVLSEKKFQSFIQNHPLVLAEFFAPWCLHSQILLPHLEEAASVLKEHNVPVVQIDCETDNLVCLQQTINTYPTLKIFKNGRIFDGKVYRGTKIAQEITQYMLQLYEASVIYLNSEDEIQLYLENATLPVVINRGLTDLNDTYQEVALDLADDYVFLSLLDSEDKSLSVHLPNVTEPLVFDSDLDPLVENSVALSHWLKVVVLPYFSDITPDLFPKYISSNLPLAYFFYTSKEELDDYTDFFTQLGKENRGHINFVALNSAIYPNHVRFLNMKDQFPLFAIHNMVNNLKYGLPQLPEEEYLKLQEPQPLDKDMIVQLVKEYREGTAKPLVKSEEIPKEQNSNVYKIVGKTHDDVVHDDSRDVLVKYYATWCVHSKRFAPIYEEIADVLASDESIRDKILIAEVNSGANDILSFPVTGYPTIAIYPAGNNSNPIVFNKIRNLEDVFQFIKESGTHHIDGQAIYNELQKAKEPVESTEDTMHDEL